MYWLQMSILKFTYNYVYVPVFTTHYEDLHQSGLYLFQKFNKNGNFLDICHYGARNLFLKSI